MEGLPVVLPQLGKALGNHVYAVLLVLQLVGEPLARLLRNAVNLVGNQHGLKEERGEDVVYLRRKLADRKVCPPVVSSVKVKGGEHKIPILIIRQLGEIVRWKPSHTDAQEFGAGQVVDIPLQPLNVVQLGQDVLMKFHTGAENLLLTFQTVKPALKMLEEFLRFLVGGQVLRAVSGHLLLQGISHRRPHAGSLGQQIGIGVFPAQFHKAPSLALGKGRLFLVEILPNGQAQQHLVKLFHIAGNACQLHFGDGQAYRHPSEFLCTGSRRFSSESVSFRFRQGRRRIECPL